MDYIECNFSFIVYDFICVVFIFKFWLDLRKKNNDNFPLLKGQKNENKPFSIKERKIKR
jgi:hypothetical protein